MKQIHVVLELGKDGYGVLFKEIDNIFGFGETIELAKKDAKDVITFYIQSLKQSNEPVPEILQEEYELIFEYDIEALFTHIGDVVTKNSLAKYSGINQVQLSHYSSGLKKPGKKQRDKIIAGLHEIGNELLSITS